MFAPYWLNALWAIVGVVLLVKLRRLLRGRSQSVPAAPPGPQKDFDPTAPVRAIAGNIVEDRPYGEGGHELRSGTKHFPPGAKVYLFPPLWGDGYERVKVIGYHRGSSGRQIATMIIQRNWITNPRVRLVHKPAILRRFAGAWDGSPKSRALAERLVATLWPRSTESAPTETDSDDGDVQSPP